LKAEESSREAGNEHENPSLVVCETKVSGLGKDCIEEDELEKMNMRRRK
jgi:hypothetical protein